MLGVKEVLGTSNEWDVTHSFKRYKCTMRRLTMCQKVNLVSVAVVAMPNYLLNKCS